MLTKYGYPVMKKVYGLSILLFDTAEKFERYCYRWLDTFEHGVDTWAA